MAVDPKLSERGATSELGVFWRILWFLGIEKQGKSFKRIKLQLRFYVVVSLFVLGMSGITGVVVYSTSPSFCRSCHIMEPYYNAWVNSKHKQVACVDCHYPPGTPQTLIWKKFQALSQVVKYVTRTYSSKPFAEVEDTSCLRNGCHSTRLLQGKIVSKRGIHFDHKPHLEGVRKGRQLRCVSCHSQIVVGQHIEVTYDTCFLCHLKDRKKGREITALGGCLGCHTLPDKEFKVGKVTYNHKNFLGAHQVSCESCHQDVVRGSGDVSREKCVLCHNQPEKIDKFKDVSFLHENHVTKHNTACFHCHDLIKHSVSHAGEKKLTDDCNVCHIDTHDLQKQIYMGVGAKGISPMPSPMYLSNVDCVGCHLSGREHDIGLSKSKTYEGNEEGCLKCHGDSYKGILSETQGFVNDMVSKIEAKVATITATIKDLSASQTIFISDAVFNLNFVKIARPIHNIYYVSQILRETDEKVTSIAKEKSLSIEDTSSLPIISSSFCATMCHEKVGVKVPAETKEYKGKAMPHKQHVDQGLACTDCHVFGNHKDVKLKHPTICSRCHEGRE